jgi:hypothetical protein
LRRLRIGIFFGSETLNDEDPSRGPGLVETFAVLCDVGAPIPMLWGSVKRAMVDETDDAA